MVISSRGPASPALELPMQHLDEASAVASTALGRDVPPSLSEPANQRLDFARVSRCQPHA